MTSPDGGSVARYQADDLPDPGEADPDDGSVPRQVDIELKKLEIESDRTALELRAMQQLREFELDERRRQQAIDLEEKHRQWDLERQAAEYTQALQVRRIEEADDRTRKSRVTALIASTPPTAVGIATIVVDLLRTATSVGTPSLGALIVGAILSMVAPAAVAVNELAATRRERYLQASQITQRSDARAAALEARIEALERRIGGYDEAK